MALDTVDPNGAHDKKAFDKARKVYFGLEQLMQQAQKDSRDAEFKETVGRLIRPNEPLYFRQQQDGDEILKTELRTEIEQVYGPRLKGYVGKNLDAILKDSSKRMKEIVRALPSVNLREAIRMPYDEFKRDVKKYAYNSGDSSLKKAERAINNWVFAQGLLARDNEGEMDDYVMRQLKAVEKSDDLEDRILTIQYLSARGYQGASARAMQSFANMAEGEVESELYRTIPDGRDKDGNPKFKNVVDEFNARRLIVKSYANAKNEVKDAYAGAILQMAA